MSKDYRCECGHLMVAQHGPTGCMANGCSCEVRSMAEDDASEAVRGVAKAAKAQMDAFVEAGFTEDQGFELTRELLLITGRGAP